MKRIAHQDKDYTIVINDISDGVRIQVFSTFSLNEINQYHNTNFGSYRVSPPGKLSGMLYGSYESQIKSAVDSLIREIDAEHNANDVKRKKSNEIFECTKTTLINMYGE